MCQGDHDKTFVLRFWDRDCDLVRMEPSLEKMYIHVRNWESNPEPDVHCWLPASARLCLANQHPADQDSCRASDMKTKGQGGETTTTLSQYNVQSELKKLLAAKPMQE